MTTRFTSLEICAGAGAQALGLERAGFDPVLLLDNDADACRTLRANRPQWDVQLMDLLDFDPLDDESTDLRHACDVDLLSGGMPRIKASAGVKRRGDDHERELLRAAVSLVTAVRPKAVLLENLDGLVNSDGFAEDRSWIEAELENVGYQPSWRVLDASDFDVPQHRRSGFLVALGEPYRRHFSWPEPTGEPPATVGETLRATMAANGWPGAAAWAAGANGPGPALVGGSKNRGGADLGPSGSKRAWAALGVEAKSMSDDSPPADFPLDERPRISVTQAALLQRIPESWHITGRKTAAYRQIGHALPPPVAETVGRAIAAALAAGRQEQERVTHPPGDGTRRLNAGYSVGDPGSLRPR